MTSLANNPSYADIVIDFTIFAKDGSLHHTGSYHNANDVERRSVTERFHECLEQGYRIVTVRGADRRRVRQGSFGERLSTAINTRGRSVAA